MNAVEAVEQLGLMGRKLQARTEGLQQPSLRLQTAVRQAADWEKVLGDPVAALSQVLGAAGGSGVMKAESAPAAMDSPLPLAPFRWEEDRPPAGSELLSGRGGSVGTQSGAPASRSEPAAGVRLARRQTSLLGILNANLEDSSCAEAGDQGGVAAFPGDVRPERRPEGRLGGQAEPPAPRGPVVTWSAVPVEPSEESVPSPLVRPDEVRQPSGQAALLTGGLQQDEAEFWDGDVASLTGAASLTEQGAGNDLPHGGRATELSVWGHDSLPQRGHEGALRPDGSLGSEVGRDAKGGREPTHRTAGGPHSGMPAGRNEEPVLSPTFLHSQARPARQAGALRGWSQNAEVAPAAQEGDWAAGADTQRERPLSMAQIEQVLAALDERLELTLLRMYGASGGLP